MKDHVAITNVLTLIISVKCGPHCGVGKIHCAWSNSSLKEWWYCNQIISYNFPTYVERRLRLILISLAIHWLVQSSWHGVPANGRVATCIMNTIHHSETHKSHTYLQHRLDGCRVFFAWLTSWLTVIDSQAAETFLETWAQNTVHPHPVKCCKKGTVKEAHLLDSDESGDELLRTRWFSIWLDGDTIQPKCTAWVRTINAQVNIP